LVSFAINNERVHGMVAAQRQSRDDRFSGTQRGDRVRRERITQNLVVEFGVNGILIEADPDPSGTATLEGGAETLDHVSFARARFILKRDQKSAFVRLFISV